jgi:predicted nucleic acid-binding Zn ribbon protein
LKSNNKKCKICDKIIVGRSDKLFCSSACKNYYHTTLKRVTKLETLKIDGILHRNRSILLEIMGKNSVRKKVNRIVLEDKHFKFKYLTHFTINSKGKMYHWVYDFAWMSFSDDEVLIVKNKSLDQKQKIAH